VYWSRLFIPTLRGEPAAAGSPGHGLLLRAGYLRRHSAGVYSHLHLAQRSLRKIAAIACEEMDAIGAQEIRLPALAPGAGAAYEDLAAELARGELRSYRQLPQIWYQIQTVFGEETRPVSGPPRPLLVKDSFSFDVDAAGLEASYEKHRAAYGRIFERCEIEPVAAAGIESHAFMVVAQAGEDTVVLGPGYAATPEAAVSVPQPPAAPDPEGDLEPEEFATPGVKTIAEVSRFTGKPASSQIKSLVMAADGALVLALLRGDHELSEAKLAGVLRAAELRPARPEEIRAAFGAAAGSLGPVGVHGVRVLADQALRGRRNMICGANRDDYHLRHVTPGEDFSAEFHDLRRVLPGDASVLDGAPLSAVKAVELGRIAKLGDKGSRAAGLHVTTEAGDEIAPAMGRYQVGIERILYAAAELHGDEDGLALPAAIAPFDVVITPVHLADPSQRGAAERLYAELRAAGVDVLLDDRDERPGVKFKDADLIGVPYRITLGKKLAQGLVELRDRRRKTAQDVPLEAVTQAMRR
jgi:prolyl-tRNA synthetase